MQLKKHMLSELKVGEFLAALGERTPSPASGAATALTAALAAALVELAGRFAGDEESVVRAKTLWSRLSELADEDSEAYAAFMADRNEENQARIVGVPEEIAVCADEIAALADHVRSQLKTSVVGDAEAAAELARAAARVARRLAELNT
jgi:formiminotetrahydrofolate cyclodeaminase